MLFFIISSIALLIIAVTMLVRANDIGKRKGVKWHVRRVGFILAGFSSVAIILNEYVTEQYATFYALCFRVGLAFVFLTTPYLPPWWKFITRGETDEFGNPDEGAGGGGRSGEWRQVQK